MSETALVTREQRMLELKQRREFQNEVRQMGVRRIQALALVRVTKQKVMEGIRYRESVYVPELGEGAYLIIRPLSDAEFVKMQQAIIGDMKRTDLGDIDTSMDVQDMVTREQRGKYLVVSMALSCDGESWSPDDVGRLPPGIPDRIYNHVAVISGFPRLPGAQGMSPGPPVESGESPSGGE